MPRIQGRSKYLTEESSTRGPFTNSPTRIFKGGHPKKASASSFTHFYVHSQEAIFFSPCCNCRLCRCVPPERAPQRNPLIYATDFYTPLPIPPIGAKMIMLLLVWQDATLRGAKDDLNLKENKTNTSRKKLKTLTEDSNQQPVKRKKKWRRNN
jgi:hypothetical protein